MSENLEAILEQFRTDFTAALETAHSAGASGASLARVANLLFSSFFSGELAQDPADQGLFNAVRATHNAAESLTKSIADGD
jgi:glutamine synthetase type III